MSIHDVLCLSRPEVDSAVKMSKKEARRERKEGEFLNYKRGRICAVSRRRQN